MPNVVVFFWSHLQFVCVIFIQSNTLVFLADSAFMQAAVRWVDVRVGFETEGLVEMGCCPQMLRGLSVLHAPSLRVTVLSSLLCSESHEGHPHGCGHSLAPQRLQWEWVWRRGLLAGGRPAGCDPHQWLRGTGNQTTSHRVWDLQNGTGCSWPLSTIQRPEAQWWVQSRQAREESHILSDALSPVRFLCAQSRGLLWGPQGSPVWEPGTWEEPSSPVPCCAHLPFDSAALECPQIEILKIYIFPNQIPHNLQIFFLRKRKETSSSNALECLRTVVFLSFSAPSSLPAWVRSSTVWSFCFELRTVRSLAWAPSQ